MYTKKPLFALVCLLLLSHCAGHRPVEQSPRYSVTNNYLPVYSTGIVVKPDEGRLLVEAFDAGSSAKTAGMRVGDVLAAVDGKILPYEGYLKFMHLNKGEDVRFMIKRRDQQLSFVVTPKLYFFSPPSAHKIYELSVIDGQQVNLAVVVIDVRNNEKKSSYSWQEHMRQELRRDVKNSTLNNLPHQENLSFVEGPRMAAIIEEYKLNMAGLISEDARAKIRSSTGATHLLAVTFERNLKNINEKASCEDNLAASLMDIKNGAVLAVDQSTSRCK